MRDIRVDARFQQVAAKVEIKGTTTVRAATAPVHNEGSD